MERQQAPRDSALVNPMQPVFDLIQGGDPQAICDKYGITREELEKRVQAYQSSRRKMALADQIPDRRVGRNEPCPCGSGKKYKKCCLAKHEEARQSIPPNQLQEIEERSKTREKLEKDIRKGFDLLFSQDFPKAQRFATQLLDSYPEDDRLHDILATCALYTGDYDRAFHLCRSRWQVAQEEKAFYQENGYHRREGLDRKKMVHFYSPSTWLEKFWVVQRARVYSQRFPLQNDSPVATSVGKLLVANDTDRFPGRQEEGYEMRRQALAAVIDELEKTGPAAIPYLLPLTYSFSWASLFVPDILYAYGTDESIELLAELAMFRFPYFAQKCLIHLEGFGERAVPQIGKVLRENPAFDELKVGLVAVLGNIRTPESFDILTGLTDHENPYVVNWAAQSLGRHQNPHALPYLEKAKSRLGALSKVAGAIRELAGQSNG